MAEIEQTPSSDIPKTFAKTTPKPRSFDEMNTGQMVFELQGSVGELKEALASLTRIVEKGFSRIDSVERTGSDIKEILRGLAPKLEDLAGFAKHKVPNLVEKADLISLSSSLEQEISKRPTRKQAILDIAWVVGLILAAVTLGAKFAK